MICSPNTGNTVHLVHCEGFVGFHGSRICHLEYHFNTIVAVCAGVMHEADITYSIWSTWLCFWWVQFLTVPHNGKHILVLSLINSLYFFHLDVSFFIQ